MKALLVTNQITDIPDNYFNLFKVVVEQSHKNILGLFIVKNLDMELFKKIFQLYFLGATKMSKTLLDNFLKQINDPRVKLCQEYNIPVYYFNNINQDEAIERIKELSIDLVVNMRTSHLYEEEALKAPKWGCINIHHGMLPKYRGQFCDLNAMAEERVPGFSIHVMNKVFDGGEILLTQESAKYFCNYRDYLLETSRQEGEALVSLMKDMQEHGGIPAGEKNICEGPIYTHTLTREQIKEFKKKGLIL